MWGVLLMFVSVPTFVASDEIKVKCEVFDGFPPVSSSFPPSKLADLKVALVGGSSMLNISWAINIDGSLAALKGTRIEISGESTRHCEYKPPMSQANLTGITQKWFHYLIQASPGYLDVQASNIPLPPLGSNFSYAHTTIEIPLPRVTEAAPDPTTVEEVPNPTMSALTAQDITIIIFGGLASLMILSSCYIIYKIFRSNVAAAFGFPNMRAVPVVQVPVLVVYPAEDAAFQQAVVALAEFLQWHGGCSVSVDMWQQERIAELGPMRWLAEQTKSAERVLIVSPREKAPLQCPNYTLAQPSIPAAAQDLYPLILNMVASQAKSASELTKFWVVQLCAQQDKRPCILAPELRACKRFCLMKDFSKLWRSLRAQRQSGKKISDLIFKPSVSFSEQSTVKLREAVEKLRRHQPNVPSEKLPFNSVIIDV